MRRGGVAGAEAEAVDAGAIWEQAGCAVRASGLRRRRRGASCDRAPRSSPLQGQGQGRALQVSPFRNVAQARGRAGCNTASSGEGQALRSTPALTRNRGKRLQEAAAAAGNTGGWKSIAGRQRSRQGGQGSTEGRRPAPRFPGAHSQELDEAEGEAADRL